MLLLCLAPLAPASAHASLTSSAPADGAVVQTLPATVELTFSEPIASPAYVVVTDPAGTEVSVGQPEVADGLVTQPTAGPAVAGEYTVDYRVVSADGHPVSGTLGFTVRSGFEAPRSTTGAGQATDGFWGEHWQHVAIAGAGLLAGVALLGSGLRGRR